MHPTAYTEVAMPEIKKTLRYGSVLALKKIGNRYIIQSDYGVAHIPPGATGQGLELGAGHLGYGGGMDTDVDWAALEGAFSGEKITKILDANMPGMFQAIPHSNQCFRGGINISSRKDASGKKVKIPANLNTFKRMRDKYGVKTIISLTADNRSTVSSAASTLGLRHIYMPLSNLESESELSKLNAKWTEIHTAISAGNCYVHCTHGVDRTGAVVGRWLWDTAGIDYSNESTRPYSEAKAYAYTIKVACPPGWTGCQWKSKEDLNRYLRAWAFPNFKDRKKKASTVIKSTSPSPVTGEEVSYFDSSDADSGGMGPLK